MLTQWLSVKILFSRHIRSSRHHHPVYFSPTAVNRHWHRDTEPEFKSYRFINVARTQKTKQRYLYIARHFHRQFIIIPTTCINLLVSRPITNGNFTCLLYYSFIACLFYWHGRTKTAA